MKKIHIILTFVVLVLIGVGIWLVCWNLNNNDKVVREVELEHEGLTQKELKFSADNIVPGGAAEYSVIMHGEKGGAYGVVFECASMSGDLWKYLNICITYDETVKESPLLNLVEGGKIGFDIEIDEKSNAEIGIKYTMSDQVGNEAQRATSDFILLLTAERK